MNPFARWSSLAPHFHAALRIVTAFIFVLAGTSKLFAFPVGMPPDNGTAAFGTQIWIGGVCRFSTISVVHAWLHS